MMLRILIVLLGFIPLSESWAAPLRILSYNVWGMPFPVRTSHKNLRKAPKIIPQLKADIIGMQEVFIKRARDLEKMPEYPYTVSGDGPKGIKLLGSGLVIASKYPLSDSATLTYKACSGSDCLARKGALYAKVTVPGYGEIDLINTHLNAGKNRKTKEAQLNELLEFVSKKRSHRPMIIMGDFNLEPDSIFYRSFSYFFEVDDSHRIHLANTPDVSKRVVDSYTYRLNFWPLKINQKLDYIWFAPGTTQSIELRDYNVVFDDIFMPKLSDHYGITALFEIN
jgi:endonuclease/exonuclease/phosphatase family metal-dependent hydrolase